MEKFYKTFYGAFNRKYINKLLKQLEEEIYKMML